MVKRIVDPHFDYQEMAKRSLGPTWGKLSAGQRQEFVALFSQLLEASYSDKIEKYAQRVKIDYHRRNSGRRIRRSAHRGAEDQ